MSDHKKKYETQENVGRGRSNEVHVDDQIIKYLHRLQNVRVDKKKSRLKKT